MEEMNKLKNELDEIIQKKSNFSKLTYEINNAEAQMLYSKSKYAIMQERKESV